MRNTLMATNRSSPHFAIVRVPSGPLKRVATNTSANGCAHDPLGIETLEYLTKTFSLSAYQAIGGNFNVVEEQLELLLR